MMFDTLHAFTASLPPLLQWLGVMCAAAVPYIESYFGAVIGIAAGVTPFVAVPAAIAGNVVSMLVFVYSAHAVRGRFAGDAGEPPARRQRLRRNFERFGVPGVSLLGQTILPSQITSAALVSFGASRNAVVVWQIVSIIVWGLLFGILAALGITFVGDL